MKRRHGCQCPWKVSQTVSLLVWFTVLAGCYALFIPIIQEAAAQTAVAVLYTATAIIVTVTYFIVSIIDPADPGLNGAADGPLYCEQCQAYVQRGSKHCRECDKCVLGFDHHCKWVNNCIGRRNYRPFFVLLSSMCSMLALQAAVGIWLTYRCFTDTEQIAARLAAAYPAYMRVREYEAALLVYSCVCAAALYPLGDLLLLHVVLACRGMTTWDYIMANRDTSIEPSALSKNVTKAFRYVHSLGPRSIRVRDDPNMSSSSGSGGSTAGGHKRHVGINPCLACTTELNRAAPSSSAGSKFDHFFASKADRPEGFDAALIFTPRLGEEAEKQTGSVTPGAARHGGTQQVLIAIDAASYQQRAGDEFSCVAADATAPSSAAAATAQQRDMVAAAAAPTDAEQRAASSGGVRSAVRFAD
ncbi:hypothetical protein OEZ85_014140 [Tetradesmus obliquus]|uniref:S-acyltransferase n=1 Tax=Tetradesmus obliquus TaxID=3088 RepID=A0ABY8UC62_TETOB|nr:hypothetical protein OEZ85_014140 [Tetradesmus obliquus]